MSDRRVWLAEPNDRKSSRRFGVGPLPGQAATEPDQPMKGQQEFQRCREPQPVAYTRLVLSQNHCQDAAVTANTLFQKNDSWRRDDSGFSFLASAERFFRLTDILNG